jgi:hypothetical protein
MRLVLSFYLFHRCFVFRKVKPTLLLFLAEVLVYVLNVMRIAMLSVLMYHFPGCLSCTVCYSPVYLWSCFILWVIWVSKFSLYAKNTAVT